MAHVTNVPKVNNFVTFLVDHIDTLSILVSVIHLVFKKLKSNNVTVQKCHIIGNKRFTIDLLAKYENTNWNLHYFTFYYTLSRHTILVRKSEKKKSPERPKHKWENNINAYLSLERPPLWSSGQSSWLQIQRSRFDSRHYQKKKSSGSGTGSTQPREYN
jgi:hypothetical protein